MMTSVAMGIVCSFVKLGISIMNRAVLWGNLFVLYWWRGGLGIVLVEGRIEDCAGGGED